MTGERNNRFVAANRPPRFGVRRWFWGLAMAIGLVACGAESSVVVDPSTDTDGDGLSDLEERDRYGTNPRVADTDGDGFSDYEEVVTKGFDANVDATQFNPLVADVPRLRIRLTSLPDLAMVYKEGSQTSKTVGTEHSNSTTEGSVRSWGGANTYAVEMTHTAGVEVSVSHEFGLLGGTTVEGTLSYEFSHSTTNESTTEWSNEQSTENTRALTAIESTESSESVEVEGGAVSATVVVDNIGDIAVIMAGLTLSAFIDNPTNPLELGPVGNLLYVNNAAVFPETTIQPGNSTAPLNFSAEVNLATIKSVLRDSKNLVIAPATGVLRGEGDRSFDLAATNINARTAQIIIDYGLERPQESYRIATIIGEMPGTTAKAALETLRIPYTVGTGQWLYGNDVQPTSTSTGVTSLRGMAMDIDSLEYWIVAHTYPTQAGASRQTDVYNLVLDGYDLESLVLQKGHVLHFVKVRDQDRDGLGDRAEHLYGTDPMHPDTDRDGCPDALEVGGWTIDVEGEPTRVYPSPLLVDSDLDGVDDCDEYRAQPRTNPTERTLNNPPVITLLTASADDLTVTVNVGFQEPDPQDRVRSVRIAWGDGTEDTIEVSQGQSALDATHVYGSGAPYTIAAAAFDGLDEGPASTVQVDLSFPTAGMVREILFTDGRAVDTSDNPGEVSLAYVACYAPAADRKGHADQAIRFNHDFGGAGCGLDGTGIAEVENPGVQHDLTVTAWINTVSVGADQWIFGQSGRRTDHFWARMFAGVDNATNYGRGGRVSFLIPDPNGGRQMQLMDPNDVVRNTWIFYAATIEVIDGRTTGRLYRDGVEVAVQTVDMIYNNPDVNDDWTIGGSSDDDESMYFRGRLDDLRIYDRALSAGEVRRLSGDR